jgi:hypothetical protein
MGELPSRHQRQHGRLNRHDLLRGMSLVGTKPTWRDVQVESAFRGKAEVKSAIQNPQMIRSTTQPKRPIIVRIAGRAHGLQRGSNAARAVDRRDSEQSTCGEIAGPLMREARFRRTEKFDR